MLGKVTNPKPRKIYSPLIATTSAVIMNFRTAMSVKRKTLTILWYFVKPALLREKPKATPKNIVTSVPAVLIPPPINDESCSDAGCKHAGYEETSCRSKQLTA